MNGILAQLSLDMTEVVRAVGHGLVRVENGRRGHGAGVVWEAGGLILTNAHVIRREDLMVELPGGDRVRARVAALDRGSDLALLRVERNGLEPLARGDSRALRTGDWVAAAGHPWGVQGGVTCGTVIGVGRGWEEMPRDRRELILVSLHLRPGHSGGPLIDAGGKLVGINTMAAGPDVGVAVPVHVAEAFAAKETARI
jgi:S1-C subfamily serine protease